MLESSASEHNSLPRAEEGFAETREDQKKLESLVLPDTSTYLPSKKHIYDCLLNIYCNIYYVPDTMQITRDTKKKKRIFSLLQGVLGIIRKE